MPRGTPWSPEEDQTILKHRARNPPSKFSLITTDVNALNTNSGVPRTEKAVTQRYYNVLKGIEDFGAALDEQERTVLEQAVREVDTKAEYWWCVAARYNDIRKTRKLEDMRELNKTLAKKWAGKGEVEVKVNGEGKAKGEVGKVKMDGGQVKRELEGKGKVEEEKGPVRKSGRVKKEVLE